MIRRIQADAVLKMKMPALEDHPLPIMGRKLYVLAGIALGFFAFIPYPAITVGNNSALQIGNILSVFLVIPLFWMRWRGKPYYLYLLILFPLALSLVKIALDNHADLPTATKTVIACAIIGLTLLAAQLYLPRCVNYIMTGIAIAALLHVAVGLWQEYVFLTGGELPLQTVYVNSSFLSVTDYAKQIVRYEQRPFGLYPEPSAMSSSLAPWVLLWVAELCGIVEFVEKPARWQRVLFATASIASIGLIILSRSGHAMGTIAGLVVLGLIWLKNARATPRNIAALMTAFGIILPLAIWLTYLSVGGRVGGQGNGPDSSWVERWGSLVIGFDIWARDDIWTILFGLGAGRASGLIYQQAGIDSVFSVVLTYIYEAGLVAAIAVTWIGYVFVRVWRATRFNAAYATIAGVWLLGVVITTSYYQLLPIWVTFGLLTVWPSICKTAPATRPRRAALAISPPRSEINWPAAAPGNVSPLTPWSGE